LRDQVVELRRMIVDEDPVEQAKEASKKPVLGRNSQR